MFVSAPEVGFRDYSISAARTRLVPVQAAAGGPGSDRSDPNTEWAFRFDQELRRAEERIRTWARDAAALSDEDLQAPIPLAIERAIEIIRRLRGQVMDRVVPASVPRLNVKGVSLGAGGEISLELGSGTLAVTYRVEADGSPSALVFRDGLLIGRHAILR